MIAAWDSEIRKYSDNLAAIESKLADGWVEDLPSNSFQHEALVPQVSRGSHRTWGAAKERHPSHGDSDTGNWVLDIYARDFHQMVMKLGNFGLYQFSSERGIFAGFTVTYHTYKSIKWDWGSDQSKANRLTFRSVGGWIRLRQSIIGLYPKQRVFP